MKLRYFLLFVVFYFIILIFNSVGNAAKLEETEIFEVPNTTVHFARTVGTLGGVIKYYMVINPPKTMKELQNCIYTYFRENFTAITYCSEVEKLDLSQNKIEYRIYFIRESRAFPKDWQPDEAYFTVDRAEDHCFDDGIATIFYDNFDPRATVFFTHRNSKKSGTENIIEDVRLEPLKSEFFPQ